MESPQLEKKHCKPCKTGTSPLKSSDLQQFLDFTPGWKLEKNQIERAFKFKDFVGAMAFVNQVAQIAETEQHHPDFYIHYNLVKITLWTHAANGLTENDFILAAKINALKN